MKHLFYILAILIAVTLAGTVYSQGTTTPPAAGTDTADTGKTDAAATPPADTEAETPADTAADQPKDTEEPEPEEPGVTEEEPETPPPAETADEEEIEKTFRPPRPFDLEGEEAPPEETPEEAAQEKAFTDEETEGFLPEGAKVQGPKKIMIDAVVYVDYQFFDSSDAFKVKYHLNMGGNANLATSLIKGNAEIASEVTGYLSKWPQGQCALSVSISKIPYEITYHQSKTEEADIKIEFKGSISEKWESTCTFIGGVTKPFISEGPPEVWIGNALNKATPPLTSMVAPLEANEATSITFDIPEYTVVEENLGNAKIKGTGVLTIQPASKASQEKEGAPTNRNTMPKTESLNIRTPLPPTGTIPPGNIPPLEQRKIERLELAKRRAVQ